MKLLKYFMVISVLMPLLAGCRVSQELPGSEHNDRHHMELTSQNQLYK